MKDTIILTLVVAICTIVIALAYKWGGSEFTECIRLQADAEKYPQFYITEWQSQQCLAHQITINAPIK